MPKHLTFADIPVRSMFVTGPSETLYIKLDNDPMSFSQTMPNGAGMGGNIPGGNAVSLEDGRKVWTPSNRIVLEPKNKHFVEAGQKYVWEHMCAAAQAEQTRLMEEASRY